MLVQAYVTIGDLKALSLCSKYNHDLTRDFVFRDVKLYKATLEAFDGGILSDLKSGVRHITLSELVRPQALTEATLEGNEMHGAMVETIELALLFSNALRLFPNLTSLHIPYTATRDFESAVPAAIFLKLESYPFFTALKSLSIECTLIHQRSPHYISPPDVFSALSAESLDFIPPVSPTYSEQNQICLADIKWPTGLQEVTTSYLGRGGFDLNALLGAGLSNLWSLHYGTIPPCLFFLHSETTLRKLKIKTASITMDRTYHSVHPSISLPFANVKDLWIIHDSYENGKTTLA
ncbi:hypothetical protein ABW20_dc0101633 [Dactylellina cionopaga]|nr:hypothetical protein ABW20_dc0101633 [Dactylellina cionopaga]